MSDQNQSTVSPHTGSPQLLSETTSSRLASLEEPTTVEGMSWPRTLATSPADATTVEGGDRWAASTSLDLAATVVGTSLHRLVRSNNTRIRGGPGAPPRPPSPLYSCTFRFCVMSWKGESEPNIKFWLGRKIDVVHTFTTIQNFGQLIDGESIKFEWNIFQDLPHCSSSTKSKKS